MGRVLMIYLLILLNDLVARRLENRTYRKQEPRGFLVPPGDLLHSITMTGGTVAVPCPQAFHARSGAQVPECPPVPSKALARMFLAAL